MDIDVDVDIDIEMSLETLKYSNRAFENACVEFDDVRNSYICIYRYIDVDIYVDIDRDVAQNAQVQQSRL